MRGPGKQVQNWLKHTQSDRAFFSNHDHEAGSLLSGRLKDVCERANLKKALRQVRSNKGSAGVDGMTVDQLGDYLKQHWPAIRERLLNGTYEPKPVRRVEIPKPDGGGVRSLASQPCWIVSSSKR